MLQDQSNNGYEDSVYPEGRSGSRFSQNESLPTAVMLAVLKRPWIVITLVIALMLPASIYVYTRPPVFVASATVSTQQPAVIDELGLSNGRSMPNIATQSAQDFLYSTILESNAFFQNVTQGVLEARPDLAASEDSIVSLVHESVKYSLKARMPGFINITGSATTPDLALLLAQKALGAFQKTSIELRQQESALVAKVIEAQLQELNTNLAQVESEIQTFLKQRGLSLDATTNNVDFELRNLEKNLATAQAERDLAKLQIDAYSAQIKDRTAKYLAESTPGTDTERLNTLRSRYATLDSITNAAQPLDSSKFARTQEEKHRVLAEMLRFTTSGTSETDGETSPQVSLLNLERVLETQFIQYQQAEISYQYYRGQIDTFIRAHPDLPQDILAYFNMTRTKSVLQKTIDTLVEIREKTRIKMASETGGVKIIDQPDLPGQPVQARRGLKLLGALVGALSLGMFFAWVINFLDNTIQSESDVQMRFGLPVYGSLPVLDESYRSSRRRSRHKEKADEDPLPVQSNGKANFKRLNFFSETSPVSEAYRSIKTAIMFTMRERNTKSFVITSPVASDGKSLTTFNLGVSFAQGGMRVLVIDADLRRASQHKLSSVKRDPGLADVLHGKVKVDDALLAMETKGLYLLPAGTRVNNPAELVSSSIMKNFLDEMCARFDLVLVDTPPITPCTDSRHIAEMTGGIILIVRAEATKINILEHSLNLCRRVNCEILGVVVNHATFRYGYGYYYIYQRYNPYGYYYSGYQYYYSQDPESGERLRKKKRKSHYHSYDSAE